MTLHCIYFISILAAQSIWSFNMVIGDAQVAIRVRFSCSDYPGRFIVLARALDHDNAFFGSDDTIGNVSGIFSSSPSGIMILNGTAGDGALDDDIEPRLEIRHSCGMAHMYDATMCGQLINLEHGSWRYTENVENYIGVISLDSDDEFYCMHPNDVDKINAERRAALGVHIFS